MLKKIIVLFSIMSLGLVSLTACGDDKGSSSAPTSTGTQN